MTGLLSLWCVYGREVGGAGGCPSSAGHLGTAATTGSTPGHESALQASNISGLKGFFWTTASASLTQCPIVVYQRATQLFGSVWKVTL